MLNAATPQTYGATQTLTTSGGSGTGAVSYAITGQSAAVSPRSSGRLTANAGTGWADLQATKAGDGSYNPITSATVRVNFQPKRHARRDGGGQNLRRNDGCTITGRSLTGVLGADDTTLTGGTAVFVSKTAGTGKTCL